MADFIVRVEYRVEAESPVEAFRRLDPDFNSPESFSVGNALGEEWIIERNDHLFEAEVATPKALWLARFAKELNIRG